MSFLPQQRENSSQRTRAARRSRVVVAFWWCCQSALEQLHLACVVGVLVRVEQEHSLLPGPRPLGGRLPGVRRHALHGDCLHAPKSLSRSALRFSRHGFCLSRPGFQLYSRGNCQEKRASGIRRSEGPAGIMESAVEPGAVDAAASLGPLSVIFPLGERLTLSHHTLQR